MSELMDDLAPAVREVRARFENQVEPHRQALWTYCRQLTGSVWDAEDLVQEVMQRALAGLADYWQPLHPRAYLFRVATNLWIDKRRRAVRAELQDLTEAMIDVRVQEPQVRIEAHAVIAQLVDRLTPLQRVVFLLCESFDFRTAEVAQLLTTTDGAVKAALHRARVALAATRETTREKPASMSTDPGRDAVVRKYIEAFDARDADALAALLYEDAVTTIVGSAVEVGREVSRANSLAEWAQEPYEQWARPGVLDGREVLFIHARDDARATDVLYSIIDIEVSDGRISHQRNYFFSPELLEHAALTLGIPVLTHGHRYVAGETV